jgi:hypothetical protein
VSSKKLFILAEEHVTLRVVHAYIQTTQDALALEYLKRLRPKDGSKGCYFSDQITGEETMYHLLEFVNAHQHLAYEFGEKQYLEELRRANQNSLCLRK